ncbi:MAG: hypothetical protein KGL39_08450 [Patescibacteria group bacterium]|nr:hypothetical protein [Patescibacteria group bacterium]
MHGDHFPIYGKTYVALVGDAGCGKSTAKGFAKRMLREVDRGYLISASIQSHQDIIDQMANDPSAIRTWKDKTDPTRIHEYRVYYAIANELASLLSTDKKGMVEFLTDVYDDEEEFTTGYKGQRREAPERKQTVPFPYVSILACAVPKWFMGNLKLDLFDGGLGRRLIIVHANKTRLVPNPKKAENDSAAWRRAVAHLQTCASEAVQGEVKKTEAAQKWWDTWYMDTKRFGDTDPILSQFDQTMHIQLLKVSLLLAKSEDPHARFIEIHHMVMAEKMLASLKPEIRRLTSGLGRNELAGVGAQLLEFIERTGGMQTEVNVKKQFWSYANLPEFLQIIQHYQQVGDLDIHQIGTANGLRTVYVTAGGRARYSELQSAAGLVNQGLTALPPSSSP